MQPKFPMRLGSQQTDKKPLKWNLVVVGAGESTALEGGACGSARSIC
jgi:hypothetical protein